MGIARLNLNEENTVKLSTMLYRTLSNWSSLVVVAYKFPKWSKAFGIGKFLRANADKTENNLCAYKRRWRNGEQHFNKDVWGCFQKRQKRKQELFRWWGGSGLFDGHVDVKTQLFKRCSAVTFIKVELWSDVHDATWINWFMADLSRKINKYTFRHCYIITIKGNF